MTFQWINTSRVGGREKTLIQVCSAYFNYGTTGGQGEGLVYVTLHTSD